MSQAHQWPSRACLGIARQVLDRRGSARIVAAATRRGQVRPLLAEYRAYLDEAERQLIRDGIRITGTAKQALRQEWSDLVAEHRPGVPFS